MELSPIEIDATQLVDNILNGFLDARVPIMCAVIANALASVLVSPNEEAGERRKVFAEMLVLVRERLDILEMTMNGQLN